MRLVALLPKHHGEPIDSQDDYTDVDSVAFHESAILHDIDVDVYCKQMKRLFRAVCLLVTLCTQVTTILSRVPRDMGLDTWTQFGPRCLLAPK